MVAQKMLLGFIGLLCVSATLASTCTSPQVTSTSFTTQDATIVSQIAYIAEFSLKCGNSESPSLFAEVDGLVMPVARVGDNKYQVSWSEEIKKSSSGDHVVRLFDDEGFSTLRKAQRSGEDITGIKALTSLVVKHPGAYKGAWFNSEVVAGGLSILVAYFAITERSKLLA